MADTNQHSILTDEDQFETLFESDYVKVPDLKELRELARQHWNCDAMANVDPSVIIPAGSMKKIVIVGLKDLHNTLTQGVSSERCIDYISKRGIVPNIFGIALAKELFREKIPDRKAVFGFDYPEHLAVMSGYNPGIPMMYAEQGSQYLIIRCGREQFQNEISYPDGFMYWSD